jgi:hypothetical protein
MGKPRVRNPILTAKLNSNKKGELELSVQLECALGEYPTPKEHTFLVYSPNTKFEPRHFSLADMDTQTKRRRMIYKKVCTCQYVGEEKPSVEIHCLYRLNYLFTIPLEGEVPRH